MLEIDALCEKFVNAIRTLRKKIIHYIKYTDVRLSYRVCITIGPVEDPTKFLHELSSRICFGTNFYMRSATWSSAEKTSWGKNGRIRDEHGRYTSIVPITYTIVFEEQIEVPKGTPNAITRVNEEYGLQDNIIDFREDYQGEIFKYVITFDSYKEERN